MTIRTLLKIIKARLEGAKGAWAEELPSVLWAYRTTVKTPTREAPFRLTYGTEVVIPIEVGVTSMKREFFEVEGNEEEIKINLDCLDKVRVEASHRIERYQHRMTNYYNQRVRLRRFNIGDLVLQKVMPATKDPQQGKLGKTHIRSSIIQEKGVTTLHL